MGTRGEWSKDFLKALGNPNPDARTINLVSAWTRAEGTEAAYNPLATTLKYGGYTNFNPVGVKNYANRGEGISATVLTLKSNFPGYAGIVDGLTRNDPEKALASMYLAPWGTNFGKVEAVWRSGDISGEPLKSEAFSTSSGSIGGAPTTPKGNAPYPGVPRLGGETKQYATPEEAQAAAAAASPLAAAKKAVSPEAVKNIAKMALGFLLAIVGVGLLIYGLVNTKQVQDTVKVAAKVAAV